MGGGTTAPNRHRTCFKSMVVLCKCDGTEAHMTIIRDRNYAGKCSAAVRIGLAGAMCLLGQAFPSSGAGAPQGVTSVITLQRVDSSSSTNAWGTVTITQAANLQQFSLTVRNIVPAVPNTPPGGLALFLSQSPGDTNNFYLVNVLDAAGTNGAWRLELTGTSAAPPQLGVTDVTNLVGRLVEIADAATNVYLETIIPPFAPVPAKLSYNRRVNLVRPSPAPSPKAEGQIIVKLNGTRGGSSLRVRAKRLRAGDGYCAFLVSFPGQDTGGCMSQTNSINGTVKFGGDTTHGGQLFLGALSNGVVRVDQLSGLIVEIQDSFGVTHLQGTIP